MGQDISFSALKNQITNNLTANGLRSITGMQLNAIETEEVDVLEKMTMFLPNITRLSGGQLNDLDYIDTVNLSYDAHISIFVNKREHKYKLTRGNLWDFNNYLSPLFIKPVDYDPDENVKYWSLISQSAQHKDTVIENDALMVIPGAILTGAIRFVNKGFIITTAPIELGQDVTFMNFGYIQNMTNSKTAHAIIMAAGSSLMCAMGGMILVTHADALPIKAMAAGIKAKMLYHSFNRNCILGTREKVKVTINSVTTGTQYDIVFHGHHYQYVALSNDTVAQVMAGLIANDIDDSNPVNYTITNHLDGSATWEKDEPGFFEMVVSTTPDAGEISAVIMREYGYPIDLNSYPQYIIDESV